MKLVSSEVSRETQQRLEVFAELFQKWSKAINLVAPSTKEGMWFRHIGDSLQIFRLSPKPGIWADLGSGGGFPGIITAIMLAEFGEGWVHLIESNQKKASFLRMALAETGARGSVHPIRIEASPSTVPAVDYVSARALADLDQLLSYSEHWLSGRASTAFFHKGRDYRAEVDKARSRWSFDLIIHDSSIQADSVILQIDNLVRN